MAASDVIKSYLVSLGFNIDNAGYSKFKQALDQLSQQVQKNTTGMAKQYTTAAVEVVGALTSIGTATIALMNKVSQADLGYEKFAMRMYMARDAGKQLKIVTDAMGHSLDDIAMMPELLAQYRRGMLLAQQLEGNNADKMKYIRSIREEFIMMKITATYAMADIAAKVFQYLDGPMKDAKGKLMSFNEWLQKNLPELTTKIAKFLADVVMWMYRAAVKINEMTDAFIKLWKSSTNFEKALIVLGALATAVFITGPIGKALIIMTALALALDDFYKWVSGEKSNPELGELWGLLKNVLEDLTGLLKFAATGVVNFLNMFSDEKMQGMKETDIVLKSIVRSLQFIIGVFGVAGNAVAMGFDFIGTAGATIAARLHSGNFWADPELDKKHGIDQIYKDRDERMRQRAASIFYYKNRGIFGEGKDFQSQYHRPGASGTPSPGTARSFSGGKIGDRNHQYDDLILEAAEHYGVDPILIKAVMEQESNYNPNLTSPAGAQGLMQLMPKTSAKFKVNPWNPREAIFGGTRHLAESLKVHGRTSFGITKSIASYNQGDPATSSGRLDVRETLPYVHSVNRRYKRMKGMLSKGREIITEPPPVDSPTGLGPAMTPAQTIIQKTINNNFSGVNLEDFQRIMRQQQEEQASEALTSFGKVP